MPKPDRMETVRLVAKAYQECPIAEKPELDGIITEEMKQSTNSHFEGAVITGVCAAVCTIFGDLALLAAPGYCFWAVFFTVKYFRTKAYFRSLSELSEHCDSSRVQDKN